MIENIRKYTGLMIVVLVLLFIGLVFLGDGVRNSFGSKPVMEVAGQSISKKKIRPTHGRSRSPPGSSQ